MNRYWAVIGIVALFVIGVLLARGLETIAGVGGVLVVCALAWIFRAKIIAFFKLKIAEWRSDAKQLGLWLKLAMTRNRDAHATAAMTHQMAFLQGRVMSPMNLFGIAIIAIALSMGALGFQEWRINRVKRERDAPCSERELTRNDDGDFRTRRASCAALGETIVIVNEWATRYTEMDARWRADLARVHDESESALAREQARRQRSAASLERQWRRVNEALTSVGGGPAPDLDRSLCELAGNPDCAAPAAASGSAAPADTGGVPSGSGDADDVAATDATR